MKLTVRLSLLWVVAWFGGSLFLSSSSTAHVLTRTLGLPELAHPLGFDVFGRDLFHMVLHASLISGVFAAGVVLVSTFLAVTIGSSLPFLPASVRFLVLRVLEIFLAFPTLLFALAVAAIRGPGWDTLILSLMIGTLPGFTRLIHARVTELMTEDFVLASIGLGAGPGSILRTHLLPHLLSLCVIKLPNLFAHALLAEATLSFLGVGAPIGRDTWGSLLAQGKDYLLESPHIALGVGTPLVLTVLALQRISESRSS